MDEDAAREEERCFWNVKRPSANACTSSRKNLSNMPKGYFQGERVLPGTRLVMGMDVHEFTSPIDKITMGARRA